MTDNALLIGNSSGIGAAVTKRLLEGGWVVSGISKSPLNITGSLYRHIVKDVSDDDYEQVVSDEIKKTGQTGLCIYFAGTGALLNFSDIGKQADILEVNLVSMVRTAAVVIPAMMEQGFGHFIGISSMADRLIEPNAAGYHSSKAGMSVFLEGLALAVRPKNINVTNIRFGYVDTKMAKGPVKPFMMSVDMAAEHVIKCIMNKPIRYSAPKVMIPVAALAGLRAKLRIALK